MAKEEEIPRATHMGELTIGDTTIPCAVLEDGTRVLTQEGFLTAIGRAEKAKGGQGSTIEKTPAFFAAKNLQPFITPELAESSKPIQFRTLKGNKAYGFRAELLPGVCIVYLSARDVGALHPTQRHIADMASILVRGFAEVGIIALVDEATGYQDIRARQALEKILDEFISKELCKWAKTFPDEFYKELFRLREWQYSPFSVKRPGVVGKWTNDLVYKRLAPGVLDELKRLNPPTANGKRKVRHHQWLTKDVGHPRLREHLSAVIALMKASANWMGFYRMIQRALPKYNVTQEIPFSYHEE